MNQPEGSEAAKLWKNLSAEEASQIKTGDGVQLVPTGTDKSGKPKHNIVLLDAPSVAAPHSETVAKSEEWTNEQKRAIAAKVNQHADLMKFCLEQSRSKFDGLVESEESFKTLATTLFISAIKY